MTPLFWSTPLASLSYLELKRCSKTRVPLSLPLCVCSARACVHVCWRLSDRHFVICIVSEYTNILPNTTHITLHNLITTYVYITMLMDCYLLHKLFSNDLFFLLPLNAILTLKAITLYSIYIPLPVD